MYKSLLAKEMHRFRADDFSAPIIEVRRCLAEVIDAEPDFAPGFDFAFEFPEFVEPAARIVSKNLEAWGNELLLRYQQRHAKPDERSAFTGSFYYLRGTYEVVRHDAAVICVRYDLEQLEPGAAHRSTTRRVQNFLVEPFQPVTIQGLITTQDALGKLAEICRDALLQQKDICLDEEHVRMGTMAAMENFELFEICNYGIRFIFEEYQVAGYAAGAQFVDLPYERLEGIVCADLLLRLPYEEF